MIFRPKTSKSLVFLLFLHENPPISIYYDPQIYDSEFFFQTPRLFRPPYNYGSESSVLTQHIWITDVVCWGHGEGEH